MREILKDNFEAEFSNIEKDFRDAVFLAIDSEFSGLFMKEHLSPGDSIEDRYNVQRKEVANFINFQIGITAFHYSALTNSYIPTAYCFYIFPQSVGSLEHDIAWKPSSIEFLRNYNFDFNKLIYRGIPYLSHEHEKYLRNNYTMKSLIEDLKHNLTLEERNELQALCSHVSKWIATNKLPDKQDKVDSNATSEIQTDVKPLVSKESNNSRTEFDEQSDHNENLNTTLESVGNNSRSDTNCDLKARKSKQSTNLQGKSRIENSRGNDMDSDSKLQTSKRECDVTSDNVPMTNKVTEELQLEDKSEDVLHEKSAKQNGLINGKKKASLYLSLKRKALESGGEKEKEDEELSPLEAFIIYHEITERFPQVIVYPENNRLRAEMKSSEEESAAVDPLVGTLLKEKAIHNFKGFTRVVDLLTELRKPIVGHNMFTDLMMMTKQFHGTLPDSYQDFKEVVNNLFPFVYDTKFLGLELRRRFRRNFRENRPWDSTSLEELYNYFENFKRVNTVACIPNVLPCDKLSDSDFASGRFHDAAWDSYCAGFLFIRMVHMLITMTVKMESSPRLLKPEEYFSHVARYCNHVNIMMANIKYTVLDSGDPESEKVFELVFQARKNCPLDISKIVELCSRHGKCEITPWGKRQAFARVRAIGAVRGIMKTFRSHPDVKVVKYSLFKHNVYIRSALWAACISSAVGCGYLIYKAVTD